MYHLALPFCVHWIGVGDSSLSEAARGFLKTISVSFFLSRSLSFSLSSLSHRLNVFPIQCERQFAKLLFLHIFVGKYFLNVFNKNKFIIGTKEALEGYQIDSSFAITCNTKKEFIDAIESFNNKHKYCQKFTYRSFIFLLFLFNIL